MKATKSETVMNEKPATEGQSPGQSADPRRAEATPQVVAQPDPEVRPQAQRRHFSSAYKRSIVEQADQCREPGEVGALLRREGLYSSHLSDWRRALREGLLEGTKARARGPAVSEQTAVEHQLAELETKNARLEQELEKARTIIDVQKKLSVLLSTTPNSENS